jgi:adenine deaminase
MPMLMRMVWAVMVAALAGCGDSAPDTVLINGKIFTANPRQPWVEALAIRGDRIVGTADTATIRAMASQSTRQIDLGGRTVIPGINDAHVHVGPRPVRRSAHRAR